ncbi:MAG: Fe-S cluster assembly sulfur transfer protein SufU [Verrucomicrobiota bacterium]
MSDLTELYQAVILDHNKHPRHRGRPPTANRVARGENPTCGDECTVYLNFHDGRIADIGFTGAGCAISQASASLMTTLVKGKTPAEVADLFDHFKHIVTTGEHPDDFTEIAAFAGVHAYPARIKCATLAWHATLDALEGPPAGG